MTGDGGEFANRTIADRVDVNLNRLAPPATCRESRLNPMARDVLTFSGPESRIAMRCLALDRAAGSTYNLLARNGVAAVLLKGAGLARLLGDEHSRYYTDVDLLVAPDTFDAAQEVLSRNGYRPVMAGARPDDLPWHERPWQAAGRLSLTIDLHRGFSGVTDPAAFWRELSGSATHIALAGCPVAVPGEAGAALVAGLHAASPGPSTRPWADLRRALEALPGTVWPAAADLARRVGAEPAFSAGLRQVDGGRELATALRLPDLAGTCQRIQARRGSRAALAWARLGELPSTREKIRHLRRRLLPSPSAMRYAYPRARGGPTGLTLAYLNRIGYYAWHIRSAIRETRAVRRTGG
jgi:hypothetical protein